MHGGAADEAQDRAFAEMFGAPGTSVDLHPDLQPYLRTLAGGMEALQHPLVYSVPHNAALNFYLNKQYLQARDAVAEALGAKQWNAVIGMTQRPYRMDVLVRYGHQMAWSDYWHSLRFCWTDAENLWQMRENLPRLLGGHYGPDDTRAGLALRHTMMDMDELPVWDRLTGQCRMSGATLYRGCKPSNKRGHSWTPDREKAEWFAVRPHSGAGKPLVLAAKITDPTWLVAYLDSRSENEVVLLPTGAAGVAFWGHVRKGTGPVEVLDVR